jgi:hypothetical protein
VSDIAISVSYGQHKCREAARDGVADRSLLLRLPVTAHQTRDSRPANINAVLLPTVGNRPSPTMGRIG